MAFQRRERGRWKEWERKILLLVLIGLARATNKNYDHCLELDFNKTLSHTHTSRCFKLYGLKCFSFCFGEAGRLCPPRSHPRYAKSFLLWLKMGSKIIKFYVQFVQKKKDCKFISLLLYERPSAARCLLAVGGWWWHCLNLASGVVSWKIISLMDLWHAVVYDTQPGQWIFSCSHF